jgi:hypothetical protein
MTYPENDKYPKETWTQDGFEAVRCVIVPWSERYAEVARIADNGGELYPYNTSILARAIGAGVEGHGNIKGQDANGLGYYDDALITIRYSSNAPEYQESGVFVSEYMEPSGELLQLDYEDFRWESASGTELKPSEAPTKLVPGTNYVLVFHRVNFIPAAAESLVDYCNAGPVTAYTLGRTFAAETLLYRGYTASRDLKLGSLPTWRYALTFSHRPVGWNKFWRAGGSPPGYEDIYHVNGSDRYINHPLGNFIGLTP